MSKELSRINRARYDVDCLGRKYVTPIEERAKKSKFAKLIAELSEDDLKALGYCLLLSPKVKQAIDCYSQSSDHSVQMYALEQEYKKRTH